MLGVLAVAIILTVSFTLTIGAEAQDYYRGKDWSVERHNDNITKTYTFGLPSWYAPEGRFDYKPYDWTPNILRTGDYYVAFNPTDCSATFSYPDKTTMRETIRLFILTEKIDVYVPDNCGFTFDNGTAKFSDPYVDWTLELQDNNVLKSTYEITNMANERATINLENEIVFNGDVYYEGELQESASISYEQLNASAFVNIGDYSYDYTKALDYIGQISVDKNSLRVLYNGHGIELAPFDTMTIDPDFSVGETSRYEYRAFFQQGQFDCSNIPTNPFYTERVRGGEVHILLYTVSSLARCFVSAQQFSLSTLGDVEADEIGDVVYSAHIGGGRTEPRPCQAVQANPFVAQTNTVATQMRKILTGQVYHNFGSQCDGQTGDPISATLSGPIKTDIINAIENDAGRLAIGWRLNNMLNVQNQPVAVTLTRDATLAITVVDPAISTVRNLQVEGSPGNWSLSWLPGLPNVAPQSYDIEHWNEQAQQWRLIDTTTDTTFTTDSNTEYLRIKNTEAGRGNDIIALKPTPNIRYDFDDHLLGTGSQLNPSLDRLVATTENFGVATINNFEVAVLDVEGTNNIANFPQGGAGYWTDKFRDVGEGSLQSWTVAFWVKPNSGNYKPLWTSYADNGQTRISGMHFNNPSTLLVGMGGSFVQWPLSEPIDYTKWQHIALTFDGQTASFANMRLYLNGTLVPSDNSLAWGSNTFTTMAIGGESADGMIPCLNCEFKDWVLYEQVLSVDDINLLKEMRLYKEPPPPPPSPTELTFNQLSFTSVDLTWTEPPSDDPIVGYQINRTTPHGIPLDIFINNTETVVTEYPVTGLQPDTAYSFRVSARTAEAIAQPSNILDITTLANITSIIDLPTNVTNPEQLNFQWQRQDIPGTNNTLVEVTYPASFNVGCEVSYRFSGEQQFYPSPPRELLPNGRVETVFQMNNYENDIATITCYDNLDRSESSAYVVTHTNIPIIDQIDKFRSGEYGTVGFIGTLDLVGLMGVIVAQLGLNRKNEAAGVIVGALTIGALGFFGVLTIPALITGVIVVVALFAVVTTRKD